MTKSHSTGRVGAPAFALAGQIVKTEAHARRILRRAIVKDQQWIIPQARSVARILAASAKAST
jgi:hypothetical protein